MINGVKKMKIHTKEKMNFINPKTNNNSKQIICDLLGEAIAATTAGDDLEALRYDPVKEIVHVDFRDAYDARQINVAMDSGWAMIKDIVRQIDIG